MRTPGLVASLLVLLLATSAAPAAGVAKEISPEVLQIIYDWAPLIWLHPEELYFPSTVDYHFEHVQVRDENDTIIQDLLDRYTIVTGPATSSYHLHAVPELECGDCVLDWFVGQNISQMSVPTYVFVEDYEDACGTVDVVYRGFYPYNLGKDVCVGLPHGGLYCNRTVQSFGNHVGDWEHYTIRIRGGQVTDCYVSVHSFGAWYSWNETANNFQFTHGEDSRVGGDGKISIIDADYPRTVEVVEGFHAELFSANGSHGLWSSEGVHEYAHWPVYLQDHGARGYAWRSWDDLDIVLYDPDTVWVGELHYLDFRGRWGNIEKQGCQVEPISGECVLTSGPGYYPQGPGDFPDDCGAL